jgi:hypothetical protein
MTESVHLIEALEWNGAANDVNSSRPRWAPLR